MCMFLQRFSLLQQAHFELEKPIKVFKDISLKMYGTEAIKFLSLFQ